MDENSRIKNDKHYNGIILALKGWVCQKSLHEVLWVNLYASLPILKTFGLPILPHMPLVSLSKCKYTCLGFSFFEGVLISSFIGKTCSFCTWLFFHFYNLDTRPSICVFLWNLKLFQSSQKPFHLCKS